jgi:hypothetical protein
MTDLGDTPPVQPTAIHKEIKMADPIHLKPNGKTPDDAGDINSLWLDPALGDGLVDVHYHSIPVGKPKDYFRVNPDPAYRRLTEVYIHKSEEQMDEQTYIIDKPMRGVLTEARRCTLVTTIYRDGSPRLWALKLPKDGERDHQVWVDARSAAKTGMSKWVKLVWSGRAYETRDAQPGYAPEPDWSKLPSFDELVRLAFGEHNVIRDKNHPIVLDLYGAAPKKSDDDDGLS